MKKQSHTRKELNDTDRIIARNFRKFCREAEETIEGMAAKITKAENVPISHQQVQKYQVGENRLSASLLKTVSKILGKTMDDFFVGAE